MLKNNTKTVENQGAVGNQHTDTSGCELLQVFSPSQSSKDSKFFSLCSFRIKGILLNNLRDDFQSSQLVSTRMQ